jgi:hypothetical protein
MRRGPVRRALSFDQFFPQASIDTAVRHTSCDSCEIRSWAASLLALFFNVGEIKRGRVNWKQHIAKLIP